MSEQEVLAIIRTLLALERNYLAMERTGLAQLRTGLALALIGPSATTVLAYILNFTPFTEPFYIELVAYAFFVIVAFFGIWITYNAYKDVKKIRLVIVKIRAQELDFAEKSTNLSVLIKDIVNKDQ